VRKVALFGWCVVRLPGREVVEAFGYGPDSRSNAEAWFCQYCAPDESCAIHQETTHEEEDVGARNGVYGYDGSQLEVGCRVELHPASDLWMRGLRFGQVVGISLTPNDRVRVRLDGVRGTTRRVYAGSADTFRRVS
jgi:hypothetical protein